MLLQYPRYAIPISTSLVQSSDRLMERNNDQNPVKLKQERRDMFAVLLALGLDNPAAGAVIFHQDQVPEHAELAWYINCVTPVNWLMRMTAWKVRFPPPPDRTLDRPPIETDL